jgi:RNA polymerase sigma-70 factor (ECF subfamily)
VAPTRDDVLEPTEPRARELLEGYMAAWVAGDPDAFGQVLRVDAALEAVPSRTWFAGKSICVTWTRPFFAEPGAWQMRPTSANGQPAAVAYFRGEPYGVAVLTPAADGIARVTVFGDPGLVTRF